MYPKHRNPVTLSVIDKQTCREERERERDRERMRERKSEKVFRGISSDFPQKEAIEDDVLPKSTRH